MLNILRISILTPFIIGLSCFFASAQNAAFLPAGEDEALLKIIAAKYESQYKNELTSLPKTNRKDYEELYKMRWSHVKELFEKKEIYTDKYAQQYLDALVTEITIGNPFLKAKDFKCYFSRSWVPNASYIGEGVIIFNMGLFAKLNCESEAAFVLCHEIAHYYLEHSEKSMQRYVEALNSKDVQNKLKEIKRSEYGKRQQAEDLIKNLSFDFSRHGRNHESEADSLAVELMHHTKFDMSSALTALALLDSADHEDIQMDASLQKVFNWEAYPFKKRWVKIETGLLGGHAKIKVDEKLLDSLKTHPDCKKRIKMLEPLINKYQSEGMLKNVVSTEKFEKLKNTFTYEIIEYSYESGNYTRSLLHSLELMQQKSCDPYLIMQIGKIFNGFYKAQKAHTLGNLIDLPAPFYQQPYNLLLEFVQNLYVEEYSAIGYHFLNKYNRQITQYAPFKEEYKISKQNFKE